MHDKHRQMPQIFYETVMDNWTKWYDSERKIWDFEDNAAPVVTEYCMPTP